MSAAAFVLAINLFIATIFAVAFGVIAVYQRSDPGPRWLAVGYGLGIVNAVLEFILPYQQDHRPVSFAIFAAFLLALAACVTGLAYHYRVRRPWLILAIVIGGSLLTNLVIIDMPRTDLLRGLLYQAPYTLVQAVGVLVLLQKTPRRALDVALLVMLAISSAHFLGKPLLAAMIGSGDAPQAYLGSTYAAYSQSLGAVLLITNGLFMVLIIVRDMMADMTARSETDTLSALLNRRGFEDRGDRALAQATRTGVPAVMIVADLDHFKQVNDTFGHAAGDQVIARFAQVLRDSADQRSVIGRMGGEEFAIFMPGANVMTGRLYAETARSAFTTLPIADLSLPRRVTASFGVAPLRPGDTLSDLMRRADAALYEAKLGGRNQVRLASGETQRLSEILRDKSRA